MNALAMQGRNEPCRCGSGLKYKQCHGRIHSASPNQRVAEAHKQYIERWQKNAEHFEKQGYYTWMAGFLKPYNPKRIFDVGCGEGAGLAALCQQLGPDALEIISVEENGLCISIAEKKLTGRGYPTRVIRRLKTQLLDKTYRYSVTPGLLVAKPGVTLVESDIVDDPELLSFLSGLPQFDAVTIWLIGSHLMRQNCEAVYGRIKSTGEYRLIVQNQTYELADRILKSGGVLQIVDRGQVLATEEMRKDELNSHREQASPTSLEVISLESMIYTEPGGNAAVPMAKTLGKSGRDADLTQKALLSVISIKR